MHNSEIRADRPTFQKNILILALSFPILCLLLLVIPTVLDLTSISMSGQWQQPLANISRLAPTGDYSAVREMGTSGWILLSGMVSLLVVFPVWATREISKNL